MRLAVIDTETSGIPDKEPLARILEVGAVVLDEKGQVVAIHRAVGREGTQNQQDQTGVASEHAAIQRGREGVARFSFHAWNNAGHINLGSTNTSGGTDCRTSAKFGLYDQGCLDSSKSSRISIVVGS